MESKEWGANEEPSLTRRVRVDVRDTAEWMPHEWVRRGRGL